MRATSGGKPRDVVIVGSWNGNPGYRLLDGAAGAASYPGIADDYRKMFVVLNGLPCDIFLGAHGDYYNMLDKLARAKAGEGDAVWIDPGGYHAAVAKSERAFETALKRQQDAGVAAAPSPRQP
jgi:metallo-beta-lactamase class B